MGLSRQDRWKLMLSCGLNIPDFVENPSSKHKENTAVFLRTVFYGYPFVTFLAQKDGENKEYDEEALRDAFQKSVILEQNGYNVWVAEGVVCEYSGTIWLHDDGTGKLIKRVKGRIREKISFQNCETLKEIRDKIIVRRVADFLTMMKFSGVIVDFGWSKSFVGKLNERIVFFDYRVTKDFD